MALLVCLAGLVWWVLWFMMSGSLMSLEELNITLGPALGTTGEAGDKMAVWSLLPSWPTLQPITELLLDTPQFFVMFWNTFKLVLPSVLGQLLLGAPAAWALSRFQFKGSQGANDGLYCFDADAVSGDDGAEFSCYGYAGAS